MEPGSRRSLVNYIGIAILIAGLATGEFIYWHALRHPADADNPLLWQENTKSYQQEEASYMGTFGSIMDSWLHAIESLGDPRHLAVAIAVGSMLVAGGCFLIALRMPSQ